MRNPARSLQAKRFERVIAPCMDQLRRLAIRLTGNADLSLELGYRFEMVRGASGFGFPDGG